MNPTELPDSCPFCNSVVSVLADGKPCRADDGAWVHFKCLTSMHRGQKPRMCQSRPCEEAERQRLTIEADALRTANAGLVEKVSETQAALDLSARQLLETVNDRNSIGVQLDLIRDELMRIQARIGETGLLGEHPQLRSIADYCERAQKDIAVRYTPIQELDQLKREARQLSDLRERAEERVRRLEEAGQDAIDYIDGKHRDAGRVLDGWRKATE